MHIYFDLDSTLCHLEWCDWLAAQQWIGKHVAELTKSTMDGTRSFDEVFIAKTQLISPSQEDLAALGNHYITTLVPWIHELIRKLQAKWHTIGIISQWYRDAAYILADYLHISRINVHALFFDHTSNGSWAWFPEQSLKYENGKTITLREIKKQYPQESIVFIWDSYGDYLAGKQANLFIWCGWCTIRPKVQQEATYFATSLHEVEELLTNDNL